MKKKIIIPPALDPMALGKLARSAVLALAVGGVGTGHERHAAAVRDVSRRVDAALDWGPSPLGLLAEAVDGPIAKFLVGTIVRHAYMVLRAEGKV